MQATLLVRLALCLTLVTSLILAATMRVSLGELLVRLEQLEKLTESDPRRRNTTLSLIPVPFVAVVTRPGDLTPT